MYSSGSEETIPTTVTSAPSSRAGRIFPTTAGRKLLTMSTLIDLAYSGRTLTWTILRRMRRKAWARDC